MSFDPVASDTMALQMFERLLTDEGSSPASLLALREMVTPGLEGAAELGLGTDDPANINLTEVNLG